VINSWLLEHAQAFNGCLSADAPKTCRTGDQTPAFSNISSTGSAKAGRLNPVDAREQRRIALVVAAHEAIPLKKHKRCGDA
jgi:hypothetical protein